MLEKTYTIKIYDTRAQMGAAAAEATSALIRSLLAQKESIRMIFAAAPSQSDFLAALTADERVDFSRIHAFHMDEYIGLAPDAPQGFGNFLRRELFSKVPFASVSYLDGGMGHCLRRLPSTLCVWVSERTDILRSTIPPPRIFTTRKR